MERSGRGRDNHRGGRGGRGSSRGGSRGAQQGGGFEPSRDDNRFPFRGGRGGGQRGGGQRGGGQDGGGQDGEQWPSHVPYSGPDANRFPDPKITELENNIIAQQNGLVGQMAKMKVSKKGSTASSGEANHNAFPMRPAYGTFGNPTAVWANYFPVKMTQNVLYRYTLKPEELIEQDSGVKAQPTKGVKTKLAITQVLHQLNGKAVVATEFKGHLISTKRLDLTDNVIVVRLPGAAEGTQGNECRVQFSEPTEVSIANLMSYIMSMEVASGDLVFPRHAEAVDALNIILGHGPCAASDISSLGHSRFFPVEINAVEARFRVPDRAIIAARGLFQSTRIGTGRLLVNTNVTHGVFKASGSLIEVFDRANVQCVRAADSAGVARVKAVAKVLARTKIQYQGKLSDGRTVQMHKTMQGLVCASELRRKVKDDPPPKFLRDMEYPGPRDIQFWLKIENGKGKYISVADFYKQKYGVDLKSLPVINTGSLEYPCFIPADIITIKAGQPIKAKLTASETAEMVRFACRRPAQNAKSIMDETTRLTLHRDKDLLQGFGVSVARSFLAVQARQLGPPKLEYRGPNRESGVEVVPRYGSWNLKNFRVAKPGRRLTRWTWMNIVQRNVVQDPQASAAHVNKFHEFLRNNMTMNVDNPVLLNETTGVMTRDDALGTLLDDFFKLLKSKGAEFCLIILYDKDTALYNKVKLLADCKYGIHTCCVTWKKFTAADPNYFANVSLKVNLKLGGVNHRLKNPEGILKDPKTMIVGYDVTHPTNLTQEAANAAHSVVALVASVDKDFAQWPAVSWEQESKKEMLDEKLESMFASRLILWRKKNGELPENILIFRDGVSEGQYAQVLDQELPHFRSACTKLYPKGIKAKITIVVSVKRHQTRFYPIAGDKMSNSENIQNGTVVDRGITQARYWDFYLTAHDALQGTARPAHYTVVYDEIFRDKFKSQAANELERVTHNLCYLFGRATKAVSICPPAYYADIVCTRARAHRPEFDDTTSTTSGAGAAPASGPEIHKDLQDSMYYI